MTERLARACSTRPGRVLAIWLVAVIASFGVIGMFLGDVVTSDVEITSETESNRANELLDRAFPESRAERERQISEIVVVRTARAGVDAPEARDRVEALAGDLRAAGAAAVVTAPEGRALVSTDGDGRALLVGLGFDGEDDVEDVYDVVQRLDDEPGYQAAITGELTSEADQDELSGDDLRTGELFFGLPAALVILLLVFGAVVAGLVPLLLAIASIFVALALAGLLGQVFELSVFTVNMLTGMGLALGVDYSLFVLSRYREERRQGREQLDAIAATGATASRAVLFSGMTFVLAMFGLVLVPSTIFRSLAAGAILVGIVSMVAALTLLPGGPRPAGRPDRCGAHSLLRARGRSGRRREPLLGLDRARRDAPAAGQPGPRGGAAAGARSARPGAGDGEPGAQRAPRPLRVQAGLRAAERGVSRPDHRSRRDRRGR